MIQAPLSWFQWAQESKGAFRVVDDPAWTQAQVPAVGVVVVAGEAVEVKDDPSPPLQLLPPVCAMVFRSDEVQLHSSAAAEEVC